MEVKIVSGTGETISHAVDVISRNMETSVDLLHVKVIMIERKTAEEGMKDIIAGFMRSREVSPKVLIAICDQDMDEFFRHSESKELHGTNMFDYFEKMQAGIRKLPLQEYGKSTAAFIPIHVMWPSR